MRFVGIRQAQAHLSGLVDESQGKSIVLTRHGQPVAMLTGLTGVDLEDYLLQGDEQLARLIQRRRKTKGSMVGNDALLAEARRELAMETQRKHGPKKRKSRRSRPAQRKKQS